MFVDACILTTKDYTILEVMLIAVSARTIRWPGFCDASWKERGSC